MSDLESNSPDPETALGRLLSELTSELAQLEQEHQRRRLATARRLPGGRIELEGKVLWDFSSNDYLGLSQHPTVVEAAAQVAHDYGAGAGASRLVSGNHPLYRELEARLAELKGAEAALVFSSGYTCNLGLFSSLAERGDLILCDKLDHASIFDAARLSGATVRVFEHGDVDQLEQQLIRYRRRRMFVATEAVFSMDGDLAPLPRMLELCEHHGAVLVVDDAHGFGVLGERGTGCLEHWGLDPARLIVMGTLSKAVGSVGGYVTGPRALIEGLVNRARSLIYSTALPPAAIGAAVAALELIPTLADERAHLKRLRSAFGECSAPSTPIVPWIVGDSRRALEAATALREAGFFTVAIRPPTVPGGTARLRLSLSAAHPLEVVHALLEHLRP
ncbi:8-amino-7-oxononanoate synthase [bacterium]|nr:8-amino-7-oxononanoate synthase [bacterium]